MVAAFVCAVLLSALAFGVSPSFEPVAADVGGWHSLATSAVPAGDSSPGLDSGDDWVLVLVGLVVLFLLVIAVILIYFYRQKKRDSTVVSAKRKSDYTS